MSEPFSEVSVIPLDEGGQMSEQYELEAATRIPLLDGGFAEVGETVLESGAIRYSLNGQSLTRHDCAVIAGELLRRSHAPALPSGGGEIT